MELFTKKKKAKIHEDLSVLYKAIRHLERPESEEDYVNTLNDIHGYIKRLQKEF